MDDAHSGDVVTGASARAPGEKRIGDLFGAATESVCRSAVISECGHYRYRLERRWSDAAPLPFIMLNPSTADAMKDDPTIRRCMCFARRDGAGGIIVVNLYAYRSTKPVDTRFFNAIGPENDDSIITLAVESVGRQPVVCAWGNHGDASRASVVLKMLWDAGANCVCLGRTKDGSPRHPLYVRANQPLEPFGARPEASPSHNPNARHP